MPKAIDIIAIQSKVWLNEMEAAAYAGLSRNQIRKYRYEGIRSAGTLPYSKVGKNVLIKRTAIDRYLEQFTVQTA